MFHVVLVLLPLVLIFILLPILLFGVSSVLISLFGGTAAILLIKNKKARAMLLLAFVVLSLIGAFCLFPFVAAYAALPFQYYPYVSKGLLFLIGFFSLLEILKARSLENKFLKNMVIVLFVFVMIFTGLLLLMQFLN